MQEVLLMKNVSAIDISKQNIVSELCDMAEKTPIIRKIIVFGSAAANLCTSNSDIDICYDIACDITDKRARELSVQTSKICDYNCDVVYYNLVGNNLKHEIDTKGVTVYES